MTDRTRSILVGLTALAGLAGVAVLVTLFGFVPQLFDKSYRIVVKMDDSGGVNSSSRVWLNGIDIGRVESVTLRHLPDRGVMASLLIHPDVRLPKAMKLSVDRPILGGSPALAVDISNLDQKQLEDFLPNDGTAVFAASISSPSFQTQIANDMKAALNNATDKLAAPFGGMQKQLADVSDKFTRLSDEWTNVGKNINLLVQPRTPESVDKGDGPGNMSSIVARTDARLGELKETLAGLRKWTDDEQLRADFRATAANAAKATAKLDETLGKVQQLTTDAGGNVEKLTTRFIAVADDLSGTIKSVRDTLDQVKNGQGTIGKFVNDPAFYNNLNDSAVRAGQALDELKLLIAKWKKEGMPLSF